MIRKIIIKNYKGIKNSTIILNENRNILVGNNGVGKSTIIEALTLALGWGFKDLDITPFLFHSSTWEEFRSCRNLPTIEIEVYFSDENWLSEFRGKENSLREDIAGIRLKIAFDEVYSDLYEKEKDSCSHIPCEYYTCCRTWFSGESVKQLKMPFRVKVIDSTSLLFQTRGSRYISKLAQDSLSDEEKVSMKSALRELKQNFESNEQVKGINEKLSQKCNEVKNGLAMSVDLVSQSTWNEIIQPTQNNIPISQLGLGEQCILKTLLSFPREIGNNKPTIYILEEPESHLSHTKLYELLALLEDRVNGQLIVTTHSSFVANKLDLKNLILLGNNGENLYAISLHDTDGREDVYRFFYKTVNYPTLRVALCNKVILVEGVTDELVVTYYYNKTNGGKHTFHDGIELIVCNGLTFRYFVALAKALHKKVAVITDNDKESIESFSEKYGAQDETYRLFTEEDTSSYTLEIAMIQANKERLEFLSNIVSRRARLKDQAELSDFLLKNKATWAYRLLEYYDTNDGKCEIDVPQYIKDAITWIKRE